MSYTLDNLNEALNALDRGDYAECKSRLKYLIQRWETLYKARKNWKPQCKDEKTNRENMANQTIV